MWQLTISGDRGTFTSRDSIVAEYESRDAALAAYDSHCLAAALVMDAPEYCGNAGVEHA